MGQVARRQSWPSGRRSCPTDDLRGEARVGPTAATERGSEGMTAISVIIGSTRQGRFSERPAEWILKHLKKRSGVDARLLDLRDYPMPFFDQPVPPATP